MIPPCVTFEHLDFNNDSNIYVLVVKHYTESCLDLIIIKPSTFNHFSKIVKNAENYSNSKLNCVNEVFPFQNALLP